MVLVLRACARVGIQPSTPLVHTLLVEPSIQTSFMRTPPGVPVQRPKVSGRDTRLELAEQLVTNSGMSTWASPFAVGAKAKGQRPGHQARTGRAIGNQQRHEHLGDLVRDRIENWRRI